MESKLQSRRQAAADRHDAALSRFPKREGPDFEREMRTVIEELRAVATATDPATTDPVERARTLSWMGSAYFDLARGTDPALLSESAQCYLTAEELVQNEESPLFKAKLSFNFANTLRGQSGGQDIGLLEAAEDRYRNAATAFKKLGAADYVRQAESYLSTLQTQLSLARQRAKIGKDIRTLEELSHQAHGADAFEAEKVRAKLSEISARPTESLQQVLRTAIGDVKGLKEENPHLFDAKDGAAFEQQAMSLIGQVQGDPTKQHVGAENEAVMQALLRRLDSDVARGAVSEDRARSLRELLGSFSSTLAGPGDDLETMQRQNARLRELTRQAAAFALDPSRPDESRPVPGTRASLLEARLLELKRLVLAEATRSGGNASELFAEVAKFGGALHEAADDPVRLRKLEPELWGLALRFQHRRRLSHVSLAKPRWPDQPSQRSAKSVFVSGAIERRFLSELEARGHELLTEPAHGNYADTRWSQARGATVGLFLLGAAPHEGETDPDGLRQRRAQTCYDLGIALVVGMPIVVAVGAGASLPFDVPVQELVVEPDTAAGAVADTVEAVVFNPPWGQFAVNPGDARTANLGLLEKRYHMSQASGVAAVAWRTLTESETSADFVDRLERLLTMLPGDVPLVLFPAWPLSYPEVAGVFHITPFREWSLAPTDVLREECTERGIAYMRGDTSNEQRIIRAIWSELGRATTVVVDLTELNPNVCLELGIAHALGKPSLLLYNRDVDADGPREQKLFRSIAKDQVHAYSSGKGYASLRKSLQFLKG